MPTDEQSLIQSVVLATLVAERQKRGKERTKPVVTLSRDYGAGGELIARRLAELLQVEWYDREILESVASSAKVDPEQMAALDDRIRRDKISIIRSLFTSNAAFPESYRHHLVNVCLEIAAKGGVILGRGAHVILANRPVIRVRVTGSERICVARVAKREGLSPEEARKKIRRVNRERGEFLWNMFRSRINDGSKFDLTINTDHFDHLEAAADLVLIAMLHLGFDVPPLKGG